MNQATPEFSDLARSLLTHDVAGNESPSEMARATEEACQKLHKQLGNWVGSEGFRVVLDRALDLAKSEFSFLEGAGISAEADGCLKGLEEGVKEREPAEVSRALVSVVANVIWLLSVFMGRDLALRQVRRAWPSIPGPIPDEAGPGAKEAKQ